MQAFGLLVVDLDGAKISALATQLTAEGYTVAVASVAATDPEQAQPSAAGTDAPAEQPAPEQPADGQDVAAGPDNNLPFKCPACGHTYATSGVCSVGHEPVQTLPTAQVLAGATVADATPLEPALAAVPDPAGDPAAAEPVEPSEPAPAADPSGQPAGEAPAWPGS